MKYTDIAFNKGMTVSGYSTGIIRKVDNDGKIYPPKMIMEGA